MLVAIGHGRDDLLEVIATLGLGELGREMRKRWRDDVGERTEKGEKRRNEYEY